MTELFDVVAIATQLFDEQMAAAIEAGRNYLRSVGLSEVEVEVEIENAKRYWLEERERIVNEFSHATVQPPTKQ